MRKDLEIFDLIEQEHQRQLKGMELIASENFVSDEVMQAMGSYLTNKYAEGYPLHRACEKGVRCLLGKRAATLRCTG